MFAEYEAINESFARLPRRAAFGWIGFMRKEGFRSAPSAAESDGYPRRSAGCSRHENLGGIA
jgi:hypothetical protein